MIAAAVVHVDRAFKVNDVINGIVVVWNRQAAINQCPAMPVKLATSARRTNGKITDKQTSVSIAVSGGRIQSFVVAVGDTRGVPFQYRVSGIAIGV